MPGRLTAAEKVRRDRLLVADRVRGLGWSNISARYGLSERQCRAIWNETRDVGLSIIDADPVEAVVDAIRSSDSIIEDLALLAEEAAHDAVKLGAIKAKSNALAAKLALMSAVGVLPQDLGRLRLEVDVRTVGAHVVRLFEDYGLPREAEEALLDALEPARLTRNGNRTAV